MEEAPLRDFRDLVWFERNLDAGISALHLDEQRIIAGDWDGGVYCWDLEGEALWDVKTSNRVSGFAVGGDTLYAVCGRDIVSIDLESGVIRWEHELEGSSDLVACTPQGETVLATSSIFDLEMNDFLESTIWRFNSEGQLLHQGSINERPWAISMRKDGVAFLPLSRPRCGMIRATSEELHHTPLPTSSPATCGTIAQTHTVVGHVDGTLTCIDDGMVMDDDTYTNQPGTIESIAAKEPGFLVSIGIEQGAAGSGFGGAEGVARSYDEKGKLLWQIETELGRNIEHVMYGPVVAEQASAWIVSWDKRKSIVEVRSSRDGAPLLRAESNSRVTAIDGNRSYLTIGYEDGTLYLIESELLSRRVSSGNDKSDGNHRSDLAEKLRRLRS
ncbi:MAG: hypothetical protein CMB63_07225 [Euryarchaeota archaeon]|nr:hypothetical protein [Euryarchaeota archaeon]DAC61283.1 MAG TPA: hypothetical protein D7I10_06500 [Candidatus Poseidoniales archaeon]HIH82062.1 PQQ-like beta-propeller repeat protein [Candidatus Thalassarchaeaceae archaeon]